MKVIAIVQARMGATRFPNKVMQSICGTPMIGLLLQRLARARKLDGIAVASGFTVVLNRRETAAEADRRGLFLVGIDRDALAGSAREGG